MVNRYGLFYIVSFSRYNRYRLRLRRWVLSAADKCRRAVWEAATRAALGAQRHNRFCSEIVVTVNSTK